MKIKKVHPEKISCISGNGNHEKIPVVSGNEKSKNFFIFQEVTFQARKIKKPFLKNFPVFLEIELCYISGNGNLKHFSVWENSMEVHFNRSKVFLLYFHDAYDVSLWEKNFGKSTAYSYRTNLFIELHHFMKKE